MLHRSAKQPLPSYDGLRGLAALAVLLFHCTLLAGWSYQPVPGGYLAVDLFFGLSGVVIARAYTSRLSGDMTFAHFAAQRMIRIYPTYLLGLSLGFASIYALSMQRGEIDFDHAWRALATGLFFLPIPIDLGDMTNLFPLNSSTWSLFFELAINVLFGTVMFRWSRAALVIVAVASGLALMILSAHYGSLNIGWEKRTILAGLARVGFSFTAGIIIQRIAQNEHSSGLIQSYWILITAYIMLPLHHISTVWSGVVSRWSPTPKRRECVTGTVLFLFLCASTTACFAIPFGSRAVIDPVIVLIIFPTILWLSLSVNLEGRVLRICESLGKWSYPIYIVQMPILFFADVLMNGFGVNGSASTLGWMGSMLAVVVLAIVINDTYDMPIRKALATRWELRLRNSISTASQF